MSERWSDDPDELVQQVGLWYLDVLAAVSRALIECHIPQLPPEMFVRALARQGYTIDKEVDA